MSFLKNQTKFKLILNLIYFLLFILAIVFCFYFLQYLYSYNINFYIKQLPKLNIMGFSLFFTGIICGLIVYWLGDSRVFYNKFLTLLVFLWFFFLVFLFINEKNYLKLFIIYELFLLPSFFLVYYVSPNRRSIPVAIYFLTWTQFGSLFILIALIYIYINTQTVYLFYTDNLNYSFIYILFFFGFGIKVPMWPFYYWLTKTHVEASSFFSIYLSGFLVKTAVYLFNFFHSYYYSFLNINFIYILVFMGIIDSSLKMWHQQDLKKLIAYTTVQEMNILFLPLLWHNEFTELFVSFFILTHCLLSSLFFFIIDIITKRFGTRVSTSISGLLYTMPRFSIMLFISILFFTGLPYTSKFLIEILIFNLLIHYNIESFFFLIFIINWVGIIGFCKLFFNTLFGSPIQLDKIIYDLTKKELFLFLFLLVSLSILCGLLNYLI